MFNGFGVVWLFVCVSECCLLCVMCVVYDVMSCAFVTVLMCFVRLCLCVRVCVRLKVFAWSFVRYRVMLLCVVCFVCGCCLMCLCGLFVISRVLLSGVWFCDVVFILCVVRVRVVFV